MSVRNMLVMTHFCPIEYSMTLNLLEVMLTGYGEGSAYSMVTILDFWFCSFKVGI